MTPQCDGIMNCHYTKQPLLNGTMHHPHHHHHHNHHHQHRHQSVAPVIFASSNHTKSSNRHCKRKNDKVKCVLVGDKEVGKTALIASYCNDSFPYEYVPTAYDNYNVEVQVDGKPIRVELCDTAGEDDFNPLRSLCYPGTDVFLLCFSLVKPGTFYSACTRWADELQRLGAAVVLVGTQADLQHNPDIVRALSLRGLRPVNTADATILAEQLNAPYVETSAKSCHHLKEAFDLAITIALRMQRTQRRRSWWRRLLCCCR